MQRLLVDQLEAAQLLDLRADAVAGLGDARQQAQRELAADHRRDLNRAPRLLGQPIDAGDEHVLDRVGHGDVVDVARQHDRARCRAAACPPRAASCTSSSTKNGLPSALWAIERAQRRRAPRGAPSSAPVIAAMSSPDSGASATRTW